MKTPMKKRRKQKKENCERTQKQTGKKLHKNKSKPPKRTGKRSKQPQRQNRIKISWKKRSITSLK